MVEIREPGPGAPPQEIRIDIQSIDEFAALLKKEHADLLGPGVQRMAAGLGAGVHFGVISPSADVRRVQDRYLEAVRRNMELGQQYVLATEILLTAAEQIAKRYRSAEALTEAQIKDVEGLLSTASAQAAQQYDAAARLAADQARQDGIERNRHRFGAGAA